MASAGAHLDFVHLALLGGRPGLGGLSSLGRQLQLLRGLSDAKRLQRWGWRCPVGVRRAARKGNWEGSGVVWLAVWGACPGQRSRLGGGHACRLLVVQCSDAMGARSTQHPLPSLLRLPRGTAGPPAPTASLKAGPAAPPRCWLGGPPGPADRIGPQLRYVGRRRRTIIFALLAAMRSSRCRSYSVSAAMLGDVS